MDVSACKIIKNEYCQQKIIKKEFLSFPIVKDNVYIPNSNDLYEHSHNSNIYSSKVNKYELESIPTDMQYNEPDRIIIKTNKFKKLSIKKKLFEDSKIYELPDNNIMYYEQELCLSHIPISNENGDTIISKSDSDDSIYTYELPIIDNYSTAFQG